jgi:hypothetical protein
MEDGLDLYEAPADPRRRLVCFDARPYPLVSEARTAQAPRPGRRTRYDYEYKREGPANLFMHVARKAGWRHVAVTERRTGRDCAEQMRALGDEHFPAADRIRVVLDHLAGPPGLASAFNKIYACLSVRAAIRPRCVRASSRARSSSVNVTWYLAARPPGGRGSDARTSATCSRGIKVNCMPQACLFTGAPFNLCMTDY